MTNWTALFSALGADPANWVGPDDEENRKHLPRYLFLRQAWRNVVAEGDNEWIGNEIANAREKPCEPYAGIGLALERLRSNGASDADIGEVVRGMQGQLLFRFTYLLSDPELDDPALEAAGFSELGWTLVETDPEFRPTTRVVGNLHESVLTTEPTGREMRPA